MIQAIAGALLPFAISKIWELKCQSIETEDKCVTILIGSTLIVCLFAIGPGLVSTIQVIFLKFHLNIVEKIFKFVVLVATALKQQTLQDCMAIVLGIGLIVSMISMILVVVYTVILPVKGGGSN